MKNKRLILILVAPSILLLIPLLAMQFTDEVKWTLFDFIVAGVLLFGSGLMIELVIRRVSNIQYRIVILIILLFALILVWAELAVGIFGTPFGGN